MRDATQRKYVRVYYDLIREFPDVYADPSALGTWLRLLMVADAMYPGLPELPRSVRPRDLRILADSGLVTVTGPTYCIRGLDAERTRRSAYGRNAAVVRWHSDRITSGNADPMPRRDETRRDETNTPKPPQVGARANGTNPRNVAQIAEEARQAETKARRAVGAAIRQRYYRGAITEVEMEDELESNRLAATR